MLKRLCRLFFYEKMLNSLLGKEFVKINLKYLKIICVVNILFKILDFVKIEVYELL